MTLLLCVALYLTQTAGSGAGAARAGPEQLRAAVAWAAGKMRDAAERASKAAAVASPAGGAAAGGGGVAASTAASAAAVAVAKALTEVAVALDKVAETQVGLDFNLNSVVFQGGSLSEALPRS